jgi:arsenate reductase
MSKKRVLFICVHNSARSQMAEAFLNMLGKDDFQAESAGLRPTTVNPLVIEVMREHGVDLSDKETRNVFDLYRQGRLYDHVITVCEETVEAQCPIFPGVAIREKWPFPDPAAVEGTPAERLEEVRAIGSMIKDRVQRFLEERGA